MDARFPEGFRWGVATAYQVEGAWDEDGKGKSIWDRYTHTPGKIAHGDTGDRANDHRHRYREDVALMRSLGVQAYRFSISWPRILPEGTGRSNQKGIDFYRRLADELRSAGIEPFATLYHWDLPQALQDRGGWQSRDTVHAFADYAGVAAASLGELVKHYFTINEFHSFVDMGHRGLELEVGGDSVSIELAPGLKLTAGELNQVRHHSVLAHGMAVQAIRSQGVPGTRVGFAENMNCAVPAIGDAEHIRAAEIATREENAPYLTVMLEGRYTDRYLAEAGADAPRFTDEDLAMIGTPVDFVGVNLYRPSEYVVPSEDERGYRAIPINESHPKMQSSWHLFGPEVMYWAPRQVASIWGALPSTSPRMAARRPTRCHRTGGSTTPIASCSFVPASTSSSGPQRKECLWPGTSCGAPRTTSSGRPGTAIASASSTSTSRRSSGRRSAVPSGSGRRRARTPWCRAHWMPRFEACTICGELSSRCAVRNHTAKAARCAVQAGDGPSSPHGQARELRQHSGALQAGIHRRVRTSIAYGHRAQRQVATGMDAALGGWCHPGKAIPCDYRASQ
jgi:beta-glucosidase